MTGLLAITLVVASVYGSSLCFGFVWDDERIILQRGDFFADVSNLGQLLTRADAADPSGGGNPYYRPLSLSTYMLDYHLWGHRPFGYHLVNLLLHAAVSLLVFERVGAVFRDRWLALATALLFAVHPVHSESVSFVSARNNLLCTGLVLASLGCLWSSRERGFAAAGAAVALYALALLSKEPAVAAPFFLLSLTWFGGERALRTSNVMLLAFFGILFAYFAARHQVLGAFTSEAGPALTAERLRLVSAAYFENFRLLLLPLRLNAHYTYESVSFGWLRAIGALCGLGLLSFFSVWRRSPAAIKLGAQWMFWGLLPISNLVAIPSAPVAERYLYAVTPGLALVAAALLRQLSRRRAALSLAILGALVLALGARTLTRNPVWTDDLTLERSKLAADPSNAQAHMNLGITYSQLGRLREGEASLREAIRLSPRDARAQFNLAALYLKQGRLREAAQANEAAVEIDPDYARARSGLGVIYTRLGHYEAAILELEAAVRLDPGSAEAHNNLGMLYGELGRLAEAREAFEQAARLRSDVAETHYNLGVVYSRLGQSERAAIAFRRAGELDPRFAQGPPGERDTPR